MKYVYKENGTLISSIYHIKFFERILLGITVLVKYCDIKIITKHQHIIKIEIKV